MASKGKKYQLNDEERVPPRIRVPLSTAHAESVEMSLSVINLEPLRATRYRQKRTHAALRRHWHPHRAGRSSTTRRARAAEGDRSAASVVKAEGYAVRRLP